MRWKRAAQSWKSARRISLAVSVAIDWPTHMIAKVDAHHHLFSRDVGHYPLLSLPDMERFYGNTAQLKREFGVSQFMALAGTQNVCKSVYVESGFVPALAETAYIQAIADRYGFPHAILSKVDLASHAAASELDVHLQARNFRGVRLSLNWDADPLRASAPRAYLAREPQWLAGYAEVAARGLSADIMILPGQFADLESLAARFADTQIILNHAGMPFSDAHTLALWRIGMQRLARHPNIAVKISGLGMFDHHWTVARIRERVLTTIDLFGCQRCLFASNFPVDGLHASYGAVFDAFDCITAAFSDTERNQLFHDNALRLYRIS